MPRVRTPSNSTKGDENVIDTIEYRIFWTQPYRRWMVKLALRRWLPLRIEAWIEDRLYPDDGEVTFP